MVAERERNRALRIAYQHARRGDDASARWLAVAGGFAQPTPRQLAHYQRCMAESLAVHPDQMTLEEVS